MKNLLNAIKSKLSLKLSLGITAFLVVVFLVSLDILFLRSRQMVKDEATRQQWNSLPRGIYIVGGKKIIK